MLQKYVYFLYCDALSEEGSRCCGRSSLGSLCCFSLFFCSSPVQCGDFLFSCRLPLLRFTGTIGTISWVHSSLDLLPFRSTCASVHRSWLANQVPEPGRKWANSVIYSYYLLMNFPHAAKGSFFEENTRASGIETAQSPSNKVCFSYLSCKKGVFLLRQWADWHQREIHGDLFLLSHKKAVHPGRHFALQFSSNNPTEEGSRRR